MERLNELEREYNELTQKHGAAITDVIRVGRKDRESHYLFEDADFSKYRIKKWIKEGEKYAENKISKTAGGNNNEFQNI
ncbi:MAG: hypothetical protein AB7V56_14660 [Candidatus Nitrosocosmicus sp.]